MVLSLFAYILLLAYFLRDKNLVIRFQNTVQLSILKEHPLSRYLLQMKNIFALGSDLISELLLLMIDLSSSV